MIEQYASPVYGPYPDKYPPAFYQAARMARILEDKLQLRYVEVTLSKFIITMAPDVYNVESGPDRGEMWGIPFVVYKGINVEPGTIKVEAVIG